MTIDNPWHRYLVCLGATIASAIVQLEANKDYAKVKGDIMCCCHVNKVDLPDQMFKLIASQTILECQDYLSSKLL